MKATAARAYRKNRSSSKVAHGSANIRCEEERRNKKGASVLCGTENQDTLRGFCGQSGFARRAQTVRAALWGRCIDRPGLTRLRGDGSPSRLPLGGSVAG